MMCNMNGCDTAPGKLVRMQTLSTHLLSDVYASLGFDILQR